MTCQVNTSLKAPVPVGAWLRVEGTITRREGRKVRDALRDAALGRPPPPARVACARSHGSVSGGGVMAMSSGHVFLARASRVGGELRQPARALMRAHRAAHRSGCARASLLHPTAPTAVPRARCTARRTASSSSNGADVDPPPHHQPPPRLPRSSSASREQQMNARESQKTNPRSENGPRPTMTSQKTKPALGERSPRQVSALG